MDTPKSPGCPPSRRSAVPENRMPKLRDSCHACHASKLKCSKEKPRCARCARRDKPCEYLATKRTGRPKNAPARTDVAQRTKPAQAPTPLTTTFTESILVPTPSTTTVTEHGPAQIIDSIMEFRDQYGTDFSDITPSPDIHSEPTGRITPAGMNLDLYGPFVSPNSFHILDLSDDSSRIGSNMHDWIANYPYPDNNISTPLFNRTPSAFLNGTTGQAPSPSTYPSPQSVPGQQSSPILKQQALQNLPLEVPCGCHSRTLELLGQFSPGTSPSCTVWSSQGGEQTSKSENLLSIQSVLAGNEHAIETIAKMLSCPCSQDSFLLTTVSLVLFKVMDRYEAAARDPSMLPDESRNATMDDAAVNSGGHQLLQRSTQDLDHRYIDGEDPGRIAAQVVLSELHRVQRLFNGLSGRLKNMAGPDPGEGVITAGSRSQGAGQELIQDGPTNGALPFSASLFRQLEADLRKRLRSLSTAVTSLLRRA